MHTFSPFTKLKVLETDTEDQIRQRFRMVRKELHPDKVRNNDNLTPQEKEVAIKEFTEMTQCVRMLTNPITRNVFLKCNANWEEAWKCAARLEQLYNERIQAELEQEEKKRRSLFLRAVREDIKQCKLEHQRQEAKHEVARIRRECQTETDPDIQIIKVLRRGRTTLQSRRRKKPVMKSVPLITLEGSDEEVVVLFEKF